MSGNSLQVKHLLEVFSERGVSLDANEFAWAFESKQVGSRMEAWTRTYLAPPTCLTKEEENLSVDPELARDHRRLLDDADFHSAISSLNARTVALEKQCKAIAAQKSALSVYRTQHSKEEYAIQESGSVEANFTAEKTSLDFANNDLAGSLQSQLRATEKQIEVSLPGFLAGTDRLLDKDDHFLDGLGDLIPRISTIELPNDKMAVVDDLCQKLNALVVHEIRARIDATYRRAMDHWENLNTQNNLDDQGGDTLKHSNMLRAELDELAGEIDSLAGMATENRFGKPLNKLLGSSFTTVKRTQTENAQYVARCLRYLTERLGGMSRHVRQLQTHRDSLRNIVAASKASIAFAQPNGYQGSSAHPDQAPVSTRGLKPLRLVQQNLSDSQDPAVSLTRVLGLPHINSTTVLSSKQLALSSKDIQRRAAEKAQHSDAQLSASVAKTVRSTSTDTYGLLLSSLINGDPHLGPLPTLNPSMQNEMTELTSRTNVLGNTLRDLESY